MSSQRPQQSLGNEAGASPSLIPDPQNCSIGTTRRRHRADAAPDRRAWKRAPAHTGWWSLAGRPGLLAAGSTGSNQRWGTATNVQERGQPLNSRLVQKPIQNGPKAWTEPQLWNTLKKSQGKAPRHWIWGGFQCDINTTGKQRKLGTLDGTQT